MKTKPKLSKQQLEAFDLLDLLSAAKDLNEIVDGIRHKRWACDGMRLKDTPEWCVFYVKLNRATGRLKP